MNNLVKELTNSPTDEPAEELSIAQQTHQLILAETNPHILQLYASDCAERALWNAQVQNMSVDDRLWDLVDAQRHVTCQHTTMEEVKKQDAWKVVAKVGGKFVSAQPHELAVYHMFFRPVLTAEQVVLVWAHALAYDATKNEQWYMDRLLMWQTAALFTNRYFLIYEEKVDFPLDIIPIWNEAHEALKTQQSPVS